jgi:hypothetical protein
MFHPLYVNLVVFLVRPNPFDPENAFFEIYRGHQPIAVGQDIERKFWAQSHGTANRQVLRESDSARAFLLMV